MRHVVVLFALVLANVSAARAESCGTFGAMTFYGSGTGGYSLFIADFNGDGKSDAATTGSLGFAVLPGNGDGTFGAAVTSALPQNVGVVSAADLDQDGD